jgi:hypothetical protein
MVGLVRNSWLRGTRLGGGPGGGRDRAMSAEQTRIEYFCSQGHRCELSFAVQAEIPELWDCPHCGMPAGRDAENPPQAAVPAPYKTHLAYVRERRSDAEAELLLSEALDRLRRGV